jgi:hypothetical protein
MQKTEDSSIDEFIKNGWQREIMSTVELPKIIEKSNANMKWFFSNHEWLLASYPNEFVAIDDKRFVDHDKNFEQLLNRLKKNNRYSDSILIQPVYERNVKQM